MTTVAFEELEQTLLDAEDYVCVNPDIGRDLHDFIDNILPEPRRKRFDNHLLFCQKCQNDVAYFRGIVSALKSRPLATRVAPQILIARLADAIAWEMAWTPLAQTAAGSQED
jgi:anti-sigma factor RsiW